MLFGQAKRSGKRSDVEKYKRIRNRVVTQLRNAKSTYFKNLNPKGNSKKFRKRDPEQRLNTEQRRS